jgi:WD40-like Beta Propeller Repeat/Omp85 superfamily domain
MLAAAAALALARPAAAYGDPQLDWWTVETAHFHVHYDRTLEPIATRVATLAETIHARVAQSLGYTPTQVTEIVLTDDSEDANGSATALPLNTIRLYVTAPSDLSTIGDYDDWYTELVTHEYTHIAHTDNISGVPAIVNAVLGKTLAPNQVQPHWILEGLAVVSESQHTSAGRIRSNLFDMYLRADVLDGRIAGLDQFSSNAFRWPQGDLWYLYGSRFLAWITQVYGPNTMRAVSAEYGATIIPWGINRSIRRVTGRTYVELFEGFKEYLKRLYAEQMRAVEGRGLREGTRLTRHGRNVYYPWFVPRNARHDAGAEEILYYRDDSDARPGLYRLPLAAPKEGARPEELVARAAGPTGASFTPGGDLVFNGLMPFKNYYSRYDLLMLPHGEESPQGDEKARRRLTEGRRASFADVSPDGRRIVFTVDVRGTSFLEIADLALDGAITNTRDLVPSGRFEQAYTPRFSPDGRKVAYSAWVAGGFRDVRIVDVASGRFYDVMHDRAIDMTPVWSPDGKELYFSSDRSGIFNIYAYDIAARTFAQVTNVRTGAFMPALSADGKTLVYVGYTSFGHDLYTMPLDRARFLPAITGSAERPDPPTEPEDVPLRRHAYNPFPTVAPRNYLVNLAPGTYGPNALTITANGGDVVGHHAIATTITVEPNAPSPAVALDYAYGRLPVDFSLHFFYQAVPRSGYVLNGQSITYNEYDVGVTAGVTYTHQEAYAQHSLGLSFSVANFKGSVPFAAGADPYAPVQVNPPSGNINVAHVGYGFSNAESSLDAGVSTRGVSLSFAVDYASPYTGSTYTTFAVSGAIEGYIPMPWRGHQTLALRAGGAASFGDYPYSGAYYVGGYDLADNSLPSSVLSGVFNGSFVLRGYPAGAYSGREYLLGNAEYRFPLVYVDHGISTLPIYLRRLDGNVFVDYGGAFNYLDVHQLRFFNHGAFIDENQLHASVGGELWFGFTLGYVIDTQLRLGYAYGFSAEAIPHGQPYFVASSAF